MLCHDQDGLLLNWLKAEEGNGLLSEREEKPHVHIEVKEFSPDWDYTEGGAKVLIIGAPLEVNGTQYMCCFDRTQVPADVIQPGSLPFSPPPPFHLKLLMGGPFRIQLLTSRDTEGGAL